MAMTGETLRRIREQIEWSREQMGRVVGASSDALAAMEGGAEPIDDRTGDAVRRLCVLTYAELDALLVRNAHSDGPISFRP